MKQSLFALVAVAALASAPAVAAQQAPPAQNPPATAQDKTAAPVTADTYAGKWVMALDSPQGAMSLSLEVKIDKANKVTGTMDSPNGATPIAGELKDGVLGFGINFDAGGQMIEIWFEGTAKEAGKMGGSMYLGDMGTFPFTATRAK